jgi:hypothetical protein
MTTAESWCIRYLNQVPYCFSSSAYFFTQKLLYFWLQYFKIFIGLNYKCHTPLNPKHASRSPLYTQSTRWSYSHLDNVSTIFNFILFSFVSKYSPVCTPSSVQATSSDSDRIKQIQLPLILFLKDNSSPK